MPDVEPVIGSRYPIDRAESRARLNASTWLISGFGAPLRTATPREMPAMSTRLPWTTLPLLSSFCSWDLDTMTTSAASSFAIRPTIAPAGPYSIVAVLPDDFSKSGSRRESADFIEPDDKTLISAASAVPPARIAAIKAKAAIAILGKLIEEPPAVTVSPASRARRARQIDPLSDRAPTMPAGWRRSLPAA